MFCVAEASAPYPYCPECFGKGSDCTADLPATCPSLLAPQQPLSLVRQQPSPHPTWWDKLLYRKRKYRSALGPPRGKLRFPWFRGARPVGRAVGSVAPAPCARRERWRPALRPRWRPCCSRSWSGPSSPSCPSRCRESWSVFWQISRARSMGCEPGMSASRWTAVSLRARRAGGERQWGRGAVRGQGEALPGSGWAEWLVLLPGGAVVPSAGAWAGAEGEGWRRRGAL